MTELENQFFEKYKLINNLLNERLESDNGVKEYINRMYEAKNFEEIVSWDRDLYSLKRIRNLRNHLIQETGMSGLLIEDVYFTDSFYERLLKNEDPLSLLEENKEERKSRNIFLTATQEIKNLITKDENEEESDDKWLDEEYEEDNEEKPYNTLTFILMIAIIIVTIGLIYLIKTK